MAVIAGAILGGLVLGAIGFAWGAAIPSDRAGEAAMVFGALGFVLGAVLGGLVGWWIF